MLIKPLNSLDPAALCAIACKTNEYVFRQNAPTKGLYFVQDGQFNLQRTTESGHMVTVHRAVGGTLFAEASLFSERYHCDAVCIKAGTVVRMEKAAVTLRISGDPIFALGFTKLLAGQIQSYRQALEIISIRSARERVLAAVMAGYLEGAVTEFASRIGLTHEASYRALRKLCDERILIKTARGRYVENTNPETP